MGAEAERFEEPLLSVVVPTLGRPTLGDQLDALARCQWSRGWEIVVADNSPAGHARRTVDDRGGGTVPHRWIDASARRGRSYAVNCGARAAYGRWLVFCDDDDLVTEPFVAAVGDAFLDGARAVSFNFEVRTINPAHVWESSAHDELENRRPMFRGIPALWGCSGIERELFLALGGFDERYPYAEDLAFSVRLHRSGVEPTWVPRRLLHYRLRQSPRERFRQRAMIMRAVDAIAREHPDVVPPLAGTRLAWLLRFGRVLPRACSSALTAQGRLEAADRLGRCWGAVVAVGDR